MHASMGPWKHALHARDLCRARALVFPLCERARKAGAVTREYHLWGRGLDCTLQPILRLRIMSPKSKLPVHGSSMGISPSPASGNRQTTDDNSIDNEPQLVTDNDAAPRSGSASQPRSSLSSTTGQLLVPSAADRGNCIILSQH